MGHPGSCLGRWKKAQGLKSVCENSKSRIRAEKMRERAREAWAKAQHIFNRLPARLKSCPGTKQSIFRTRKAVSPRQNRVLTHALKARHIFDHVRPD